jgi:phage gp29-like protein
MRWPWQRTSISAPAIAAKAPAPAAANASAPQTPVILISAARKVSRTYPATGLDPVRYQSILRSADQGFSWQLMELLDEVSADPQIGSMLRTRKLAVAGAPHSFEPPDESDLAKEITDAAIAFAKRIPNFAQLRFDLLDADFRGFAASVPDWQYVDGRLDVVGHKPIETRFFVFKGGDDPYVETDGNPSGEPLPAGVLYHVARDKAGITVRGGFGRTLAKLWLYKSLALIDCASFLEKFGQPHIQIELPAHIKEGSVEFERAVAAAQSFIADQIGIVSPGVTIKAIEAINKAATVKDVYIAFLQYLDDAIAVCVLGATLTTGSGDGGFGHGAEAQQHGQVRQDITEFMAAQLEEMLQEQLFKPWKNFHYGPAAPMPRFCLEVGEPEDEQAKATTLKVRADTLAVLKNGLGLDLSENRVRDEFDAPEPENDDDVLGGKTPPAPVVPPGGGLPAGEPPNAAELAARDGACPHCNGFFTLAEAEKKKRSVLWGLSRT